MGNLTEEVFGGCPTPWSFSHPFRELGKPPRVRAVDADVKGLRQVEAGAEFQGLKQEATPQGLLDELFRNPMGRGGSRAAAANLVEDLCPLAVDRLKVEVWNGQDAPQVCNVFNGWHHFFFSFFLVLLFALMLALNAVASRLWEPRSGFQP